MCRWGGLFFSVQSLSHKHSGYPSHLGVARRQPNVSRRADSSRKGIELYDAAPGVDAKEPWESRVGIESLNLGRPVHRNRAACLVFHSRGTTAATITSGKACEVTNSSEIRIVGKKVPPQSQASNKHRPDPPPHIEGPLSNVVNSAVRRWCGAACSADHGGSRR